MKETIFVGLISLVAGCVSSEKATTSAIPVQANVNQAEAESDSTRNQSKIVGVTAIYPSIGAAEKFSSISIERKITDSQREYMKTVPFTKDGETVSVNGSSTQDWVSIKTSAGVVGFIPFTFLEINQPKLPAVSEACANAFRDSVKQIGPPKILKTGSAITVSGMKYIVQKVKRLDRIGKETDESWAAPDPGYYFVDVALQATNTDTDTNGISVNLCLLDQHNFPYPMQALATFALWDHIHFTEIDVFQPKQTALVHEVFEVPVGRSSSELSFSAATDAGQFRQKVALSN